MTSAEFQRNTEFVSLSLENNDAAKRISDTVSLHLVATTDLMENVGKWCAFKLEDGTSNNDIYDTKDDAIRFQKSDPRLFCYLQITPDGISPKDAWHFLKASRWVSKVQGYMDTTAPEEIVNPVLYPRYSNMTRSQKRRLAREIERQQRS